MHAYVGTDQLRMWLEVNGDRAGGTVSAPIGPNVDLMLRELAEAYSAVIDDTTGRTFRVYHATNTYPYSRDLWIDDLLNLTSITVGDDVWTADDYTLLPYNAPQKRQPYRRVRLSRGYGLINPHTGWSGTVEIEGTWGYSEHWESLNTELAASIGTTDRTLSLTNSVAVEMGNTLLIDSEQLYVTSRNTNDNTVTVVRGVNGTTATVHTSPATMQRQTYDPRVVEAVSMQVARLYVRRLQPLGMVNTPGDIGWRSVYMPKFDIDVTRLLQGLIRRQYLA